MMLSLLICKVKIIVFAGILSSVITSKEKRPQQSGKDGNRKEKSLGTRAEVKGEKQRERGTDGSHVRPPEAASAQGIRVTFHSKR